MKVRINVEDLDKAGRDLLQIKYIGDLSVVTKSFVVESIKLHAICL